MAYAIRELGLQADLTCCLQLDAGLLLRLGLGLDLLLQADYLVLLRLQELDLSALLRLRRIELKKVCFSPKFRLSS